MVFSLGGCSWALLGKHEYRLQQKKTDSRFCGYNFCPIFNLMVSFESCIINLGLCQKVLKSNIKCENYNSFREVHSRQPSVRRLYPENDWIFVQDSAPSHRSTSTQEFLGNGTPTFVPCDAWPPNSPDLNPLDYHVWGELRRRVYAGRNEAFNSLEELGEAAKRAWREIPMEAIRKAIERFHGRLELVAANDGGPIQHIARWNPLTVKGFSSFECTSRKPLYFCYFPFDYKKIWHKPRLMMLLSNETIRFQIGQKLWPQKRLSGFFLLQAVFPSMHRWKW